MKPLWSCDQLTFSYRGAKRPALEGVTLEIRAHCTALLGPNGSGKSTLLRLLLGTVEPGSGEVRFRGRQLAAWGRRQLALEAGVLPQLEEAPFPLTVRELVAMGRYPHLGPWRREGADDRRAIRAALERCDVARLTDRLVQTLSAGERQLARLARALAQEPRVLILDEPTVALDIRHEMAIFELLRALGGAGVTVLLVTHQLNLAARYADRLVVLDQGRLAAEGSPPEVLTRALVERVWRWPVKITPHTGPGPDRGAPQVVALSPSTNQPCYRKEP
ncbi:MAG: ABC transporter ATP-binding protein [Longimicrobiaceae bacterium]